MNKGKKRKIGKIIGRLLLLTAVCFGFFICDGESYAAYARVRLESGLGRLLSQDNGGGQEEGRRLLGPGAMEGTGTPTESQPTAEPVNTGGEYSFDETAHAYYGLLDESQKAIYHQVYANALLMNAQTFTLVEQIEENALSDAVCAVYHDHPELFWLETAYSYSYNQAGQVMTLQLSYYITGTEQGQAKASFDAVVSQMVSEAGAYEAGIEQELYVHDAINALASYNSNAAMNQSAYSALVNGSTVCAGYARAFQAVMRQLGYTVYYCTGTADGEDHAWNIIRLDDGWYNVDLTWDDSISQAYGSSVYPYFNLTDSEILADHARSALSAKLPACTAAGFSYTSVYGDTVSIGDIELESGTHNEGDMVITPSAPEIVDWKNPPAKNGGQQVPLPQEGAGEAASAEAAEETIAEQPALPSGQPGQDNQPGPGAAPSIGGGQDAQGTPGQGIGRR